MELWHEQAINCPYCGELITVLINAEDEAQAYIEDCQVCCRPITLVVSCAASGALSVAVYREDEAF